MSPRDVARSWSRNRRHLLRDRHGRLRGSTKHLLTDLEVAAVERLMRAGASLEAIASAIGVSRNTLQRRLRDQMTHVARRKRSWMDVQRRTDPPPDELRRRLEGLRGQ